MAQNTTAPDDTQTETGDPKPLATLHFPRETTSATLYDDGEYVELSDGVVRCSEHGHLTDPHDVNRAQCDHTQNGSAGAPGFSIRAFVDQASTEPAVQDAAIERLAEHDPERFVETVVPVLEGIWAWR